MINRTPSYGASSTTLFDLSRSFRTLTDTQEKLASGKQIQRPSDDPLAAGRALDLRSSIRRGDQYSRSIGDAQSWLRLGDDTLTSAGDALASARSLIVQANSGGLDATARGAVAAQLDGLRSQLIGMANTTIAGRPIFGGTTAGPVAYDATGTYVGDTGSVNRTVADGESVPVAVTGPTAFGTLFADLAAAADAVRTGNTAGMAAGLSALDASAATLGQAQVVLGARSNQVDAAADRNVSLVEQLKSDLSSVEDVDIAQAIVDMKAQEAAYQAALSVTAKSVQPSLLDFLR